MTQLTVYISSFDKQLFPDSSNKSFEEYNGSLYDVILGISGIFNDRTDSLHISKASSSFSA